jgi:hypothetical protein
MKIYHLATLNQYYAARASTTLDHFVTKFEATYWQDDQIGRIFAHWAIAYFGQFFENYRSNPNFWDTIFHGQTKNSQTKKFVGLHNGRVFHKLI